MINIEVACFQNFLSDIEKKYVRKLNLKGHATLISIYNGTIAFKNT